MFYFSFFRTLLTFLVLFLKLLFSSLGFELLLASSLCFILFRKANLKLVFRMFAWFSVESRLLDFFLSGFFISFFLTNSGIFFSSSKILFVKGIEFLNDFCLFGFRETNLGFLNLSFK